MKGIEKFKICAHCDGRIPVEVVICPYCAANLSSMDSSPPASKPTLSSAESLAGLYSPPYASGRSLPTSSIEEKRKLPEVKNEIKGQETKVALKKSEILPISLLVIGSNILLLGLLQLLLSDEGILTLEWHSKYWYLYSLLSAPLLYLGVKGLSNSSKAPE